MIKTNVLYKLQATFNQVKMVKLQILLTISIAIYALAAGSIFRLSCPNNDELVYVEGVDQPTCNCYGPGDNGTTFNWTFVHDNGQRQTLGTCYGVGNCISSFAPSVLKVSLQPTYSSINILNLTSQFSGIVTCTQTNRTFQGSVSATIKTARIRVYQCLGGIGFLEGSDFAGMSCDYSPYTPSTVTWTIITRSGQALFVGNCSSSENYNCTTVLSPNVTMVTESTNTAIYFKNVHRDMATAICSVSFSDYSESDNCTLDVFYPATVDNCSIELTRSNWSFIASCDIINDFSSEGRYELSITENFELLKTDHVVTVNGELFASLSYGKYLISYANATDNKVYYRGRVEHTWPLPPYPGTYHSFTFDTSHGGDSDISTGSGINISLPARPRHNCSDVITPCSCSTESLGSPAGRLLWLIGNTTVAIGDYGVNQLWLPSDNLPDRKGVIVATCQLDWIQPLIAHEPIIFRKTHSGRYKVMTIVSWSVCGAVVILLFILVASWLRQGATPEQTDEEVRPRIYDRF